MDAEHAPRFPLEHDLVEPALRVGVLRPRHRRKRVAGDVEVEPLLPRLVLAEADAAELGVGEDRRREEGVVGRRLVVGEHVLDRDSRLVLRDRGELGQTRDVAGRPDAVGRCAEVRIDGDARLRSLDSRPLELELFEIRDAPRGEEDPADVKLTFVAAVARREHRDGLAAVLADRLHERVQDDLDALVLERARDLGRRIAVVAECDPVDRVHDRHSGTEAGERLPELEPDGAAADDQQRLRQLGQLERRHVVEPRNVVDAVDGRDGGPRARCHEDPLGGENTAVDANALGVLERSDSVDDLVAGVGQASSPLILRRDDRVLARLDPREIGPSGPDVDAE